MKQQTFEAYSEREIRRLNQMHDCMNQKGEVDCGGKIKVGVDLGTANVVVAVLNEHDEPIAGVSCPARVVRDGIIVDFLGASLLIREMKDRLEERLGRSLDVASCAIPPGVHPGSVRIIRNTLEAAGFEVDAVVDEPEAAAVSLGVKDGAVIDVGGGTTGISILSSGKSVYATDEATGGTHMTLVLAGAYGLSIEEAEQLKIERSESREIFATIRPVAEKMASIVRSGLKDHEVDQAYVVGGACSFPGFSKVFEQYLDIPVVIPVHPLLVTPVGIAMSCKEY
ncbi:ethanolamine utilization protein EutJ [Enterocloster citroniae]|uniref:ethanolamine utilization protein EutJ n=1 Tax=Enterocloster citroniae TaxID=358743 RepID=UPI0032BFAF1F